MKKTKKKPSEILRQNLVALLNANDVNEIPEDIPTKWERHGDLVLIPCQSLQHAVWIKIGSDVWDSVANSLKCNRIARKSKIENDDFRSPCTELLRGDDGWVTRVDNGIKCTFNVTKCMFSAGNITEKLRIAKFSCEQETVVDLYAGIGYFTLPFLVHAKPLEVHACEWNPYAVEALERNLILNGVKERCTIHFGDNRKVCPVGVADRVNLGLIPSSEMGWKTACLALKPTVGGILHVHGVVTSDLRTDKTLRDPGMQGDSDLSDALCCPDETEKRDVDFSWTNTLLDHMQHTKKVKPRTLKMEWIKWAKCTSESLTSIFKETCHKHWDCKILHIEHVKSYAPHMDHIVVDIDCRPGP